jgi:hypothetical protein
MNIKHLALILVPAAALVALRASSQDTEEQVPEDRTVVTVGTNGYVRANGRYWKSLAHQSKIMLLYGYEEGVTLLVRETSVKAKADVATGTQQVAASLMISGFRFSDLVDQVDELYADTANVRIPVIDAYVYCLLKMRGATKQQLEDVVVRLRRKYNN